MSKQDTKEKRIGISDRIREGFEESWRSLSRIEAEGEHLVKELVGVLEKHGIDPSTKAFQDLGRDARTFLSQLNESIEEGAEKVLQRLNVPTKEDLDLYNRKAKALIDENVRSRMEKLKVPTGRDLDSMARQIRGSLEEQVRNGIGRLNLATRKDVETVAKDVKKLREDVVKLRKVEASKSTQAASKSAKAAPKKSPATRKKAAKK
jgi:polyhydroxyalkanoate synthesis regulator phasin